MDQDKKLISIISPVFNEERNIEEFCRQLQQILSGLAYDHEIILVDDGSTDRSPELMRQLAKGDSRLRIIELSRNFGKEVATTAGLNHCRGAAAIMLDSDLQHPVGLIPQLLKRWQAGAEVVIGKRQNSADNDWLRRLGTGAYYRLIQAISDTPIVPRATDFRLLDRQVIDEFNKFTERGRMTRALIDWLGFRREYLEFEAPARQDGRGRLGKLSLTRLAVSSLVAHSLVPLRVAGYMGMAITLVSGLLGLFIFVEKYLMNDPWGLHFSGPAILAVINMFLVGIILICLGLIALYIANIHNEVNNRPLYVIRKPRDER